MSKDNVMRKEERQAKIIYAVGAICVVILFLILLYKPAVSRFHETDLWWLVPSQFQIFSNGTALHSMLTFLFDPYQTNYLDAVVNTYYYIILSIFGPQAKYLIAASMMIHLFISALFFMILRKEGLSLRVSFLSALAYCTLFAHFQIYMWPMAAHHLLVIFFTLLVYYLYLETEKRICEKKPYRLCFWLTLLFNLAASFLQVMIVILPVSILAHILFCSEDSEDRERKYDTWIPLFLIYLGYPLIKLASVNTSHLYMLFQNSYEGHTGGANAVVVYPALLIAGISFLFLFRYILRIQKYKMIRWLEFAALGTIAMLVFLYLARRQMVRNVSISPFKRSLISPVNLIIPLSASLNLFMESIKNAFSMDSTRPYYYMPFRMHLASLAAMLCFIALFFKKAFKQHKGIIIFVVLYLISLRFLWARSECPSRHLPYVSFLFCVISIYSISYLYDLAAARVGLKGRAKEILPVVIISFLCVTNVVAIRVAMARDKLVNTYYIYEYIRAASCIKDDIAIAGDKARPADIYVYGVPEMPYREFLRDVTSMDPSSYNFRFAMAQAFDDRSMLSVNVNRAPAADKKSLLYYMDHEKLTAAKGRIIEPFFYTFNKAAEKMAGRDYAGALSLFREAAIIRPFLINYLLPKIDVKMAGCVTNGSAIRPWVTELADYMRFDAPKVEKNEYNLATMDKELDIYEQCIFFAAYLEHLSGRDRESREWFSRMRYIEPSYDTLAARLKGSPLISSNAGIMLFLRESGRGLFDAGKDGCLDRNRFDFILKILRQ